MYGYLGMDVSQGLFSRAVITEIDPLDVLELLGSVGGFWGEDRSICIHNAHSSTQQALNNTIVLWQS